MENKTETATLDGVYYDPNSNGSEEPLDLNKIMAKERLCLKLTKDEEAILAAAKAHETLYGEK